MGIPTLSWRGLDPTNDQIVDERYVEVEVGRDYSDVAAVMITYRGIAEQELPSW